MDFTKCSLKIEDLERYRDSEGFIDLNKIDLQIEESSRNQVGSPDIFKYWIDFAGTKVLLKEEKRLDGEQNYTLYSELIMTEMAKQFDIEAAKCDLVKFRGKRGLISHMAFEYGKETLEMTDALIGETTVYESAPHAFDHTEVETKIAIALKKDVGLSNTEIMDIITERRKQKILQLFACEGDNHIQNEGFVIWRDDEGNTHMKVAPMFDNEQSFSLHYTENDLKSDIESGNKERKVAKLLAEVYRVMKDRSAEDSLLSREEASKVLLSLNNWTEEEIEEVLRCNTALRNRIRANGKIICLEEEENYEEYSLIADKTLACIIDNEEDGEIGEFCDELLGNIDIEQILVNVEKQIKAPLPVTVRQTVTNFVKMRTQDFRRVMYGELEGPEKRAAKFLKSASRQLQKGKTNEGKPVSKGNKRERSGENINPEDDKDEI